MKEIGQVSMVSTIEIFCCYAREDQELLRNLQKHLMPLQRQGLITIWSDTNINAGATWEEEICCSSCNVFKKLLRPMSKPFALTQEQPSTTRKVSSCSCLANMRRL